MGAQTSDVLDGVKILAELKGIQRSVQECCVRSPQNVGGSSKQAEMLKIK